MPRTQAPRQEGWGGFHSGILGFAPLTVFVRPTASHIMKKIILTLICFSLVLACLTFTAAEITLAAAKDSAKDYHLVQTQMLDYEAEVGFFVGRGTESGQTIAIDEAEEHIFGICLVNDWSARDIQSWEYQPLGPFLSKNFATTVSPWVITWEALEPYRAPAFFRPPSDPQPLPYLWSERTRNEGGIDLNVEVYIRSMLMREGRLRPFRLSAASLADMYWTPSQMLTHHASNGCNLRPGDLFASGTVSGPDAGSQAHGEQPLALDALVALAEDTAFTF